MRERSNSSRLLPGDAWEVVEVRIKAYDLFDDVRPLRLIRFGNASSTLAVVSIDVALTNNGQTYAATTGLTPE